MASLKFSCKTIIPDIKSSLVPSHVCDDDLCKVQSVLEELLMIKSSYP